MCSTVYFCYYDPKVPMRERQLKFSHHYLSFKCRLKMANKPWQSPKDWWFFYLLIGTTIDIKNFSDKLKKNLNEFFFLISITPLLFVAVSIWGAFRVYLGHDIFFRLIEKIILNDRFFSYQLHPYYLLQYPSWGAFRVYLWAGVCLHQGNRGTLLWTL